MTSGQVISSFRAGSVLWSSLIGHTDVIVNLLAGSIAGAWFGAGWATRLKAEVLYRVIAVLLVLIAAVLYFGHDPSANHQAHLDGPSRIAAGVVAGFAIGVVASLLGVAEGELLIPTLIILFGADVKLAGSLSLAVSLPTMIAGFLRYSQDRSFSVLAANSAFVLIMAVGSVLGTFIGGRLLGIAPDAILLPLLSCILLISAWKVWQHR